MDEPRGRFFLKPAITQRHFVICYPIGLSRNTWRGTPKSRRFWTLLAWVPDLSHRDTSSRKHWSNVEKAYSAFYRTNRVWNDSWMTVLGEYLLFSNPRVTLGTSISFPVIHRFATLDGDWSIGGHCRVLHPNWLLHMNWCSPFPVIMKTIKWTAVSAGFVASELAMSQTATESLTPEAFNQTLSNHRKQLKSCSSKFTVLLSGQICPAKWRVRFHCEWSAVTLLVLCFLEGSRRSCHSSGNRCCTAKRNLACLSVSRKNESARKKSVRKLVDRTMRFRLICMLTLFFFLPRLFPLFDIDFINAVQNICSPAI